MYKKDELKDFVIELIKERGIDEGNR